MISLRFRYLFVLCLLSFGYCASLHAEEIIASSKATAESCLASDAKTLTKADYLKCEELILLNFSGSGGYFLSDDEMQWIRRGRKALQSKCVKVPGQRRIHGVFGGSLYNAGNYTQALEEFKLARDYYGQHIAEWMILNSDLPASGGKATPVRAKTLPSEDQATRTCTLKAGGKLYVGLFKGGIYSYDRKGKRGMLLYQPDFQYDWPVEMNVEGPILVTRLRTDEVVRYNLATNEVSRE